MSEIFDHLPERCFISHSYKDTKARERLIKQLPRRVRPYIFPPINVRPNKLVSNELIKAILEQDGLIYLEGGYSANSFWVAFERDYALRADKITASYDPETNEVRLTDLSPMSLPLFASYSANDKEQVHDLLGFMRQDRHFHILDYTTQYAHTPAAKQVRSNIIERMNRGGYIIVFWTKSAAVSKHVNYEVQFGMEYSQYYTEGVPINDFGRVLFALLDETPLPDWWYQKQKASPNSIVQPIQLYGDRERSFTQRLDDLIVCLYWLIYRNTHGDVGLE